MRRITVYGAGCVRCKQTELVARQVAEECGSNVSVEKEEDPVAMAKAGVLLTPAIAVDGVLRMCGRIPTAEEILQWLGGH